MNLNFELFYFVYIVSKCLDVRQTLPVQPCHYWGWNKIGSVEQVVSIISLLKCRIHSTHKFWRNIHKHLGALSSLKQPTESLDTLIIHVITIKLDSVTLREWQENKANNEVPGLKLTY